MKIMKQHLEEFFESGFKPEGACCGHNDSHDNLDSSVI